MYPINELEKIKEFLVRHHQTIAVAESVTSGHLQAAFSLAKNAREFYQGGITAYNVGQKTKHLSVEPIHALRIDCVSEVVSQQMALNVTKLFSCDYGVGITGYAAKVPEKGIDRPFAYFSISLKGNILLSKKIEAEGEEGLEAQLYYTRIVLVALAALLSQGSV
jgi:nicotinamide-nucleotide amidase